MRIFRKEMMSIIKEKTFISTLLMQVFLIAFYSLALFGVIILIAPQMGTRNVDLLVVQNQYLDNRIAEHFHDRISVTYGDSSELKRHQAAIEFRSKDPYIIYLYTQEEGFASARIVSELKKVFDSYEESIQEQHGITRIKPIVEASGMDVNRIKIMNIIYEFKYLMLVPLLLFLPIYLSGVLFIDLFTEELASKTLAILLVTPMTFSRIVYEKIAASFVISISQILIWVALLEFRGINILNKPMIFVLVVLLNLNVLLFTAVISISLKKRAICQTIFSFLMIILLVTKGFHMNPLNIITKLAVIDIPILSFFIALSAMLFVAFFFVKIIGLQSKLYMQ